MSRTARALASQPGLLVARVAGAVLQAVILLLLARFTPLSDFGAFGVTYAVGAIALGIGGLGLATRALRAGRGDPQGIGRPSLVLALAGAGAAAVVAAISGALITGSPVPAIAAGAFVLADGVSEVAQNLMFGTHRLPRAAAISVIRRGGPVIAVAVAVALAAPSTAVYTAAAAGALVGLAVVLATVRLEHAANPTGAIVLVRESRPYWANGAWAMLQQLDVVLVGALLGSRAAGVFTAGFRLASPAHIVTSLLIAQMVPAMTASLQSDRPTDGGRTHLRLALAYSGAIALLSPLLAIVAIFLLGPDFADFWLIFVLLFVNTAVSVVNQTLAARVFALHRHQHAMPWLTAVSAVVGLSVVVAGCLAGSLVIAALGTLSIQVVLVILSAVLERRSLHEAIA